MFNTRFMSENALKDAYFGAGCFWGVEDVFLKTEGVVETEVGYAGGDDEEYPNPTYKEVCSGETEHAEVVKLVYDSREVSYEDLVRLFFQMHNPTQFNRQGQDYGSQYRSIVLYTGVEQKKIAEMVKEELSSEYERKIVTLVEPFEVFWKAEEYHQKYFQKNGGGGCHVV